MQIRADSDPKHCYFKKSKDISSAKYAFVLIWYSWSVFVETAWNCKLGRQVGNLAVQKQNC